MIKMVTSYSNTSGTASITCVVGSGGVRMAANTKKITIKCLLYLLKKEGVINPNLERMTLKTGNSKTIPKTKISLKINPK